MERRGPSQRGQTDTVRQSVTPEKYAVEDHFPIFSPRRPTTIDGIVSTKEP